MSPVGAIFVPFPTKTGTNLVHPLPSPLVELVENPKGSHRIKHIDVRFHFLRGLVRLGQVTIHSVASAEQHADILSKPLGREAFRRHRDFLMNLS